MKLKSLGACIAALLVGLTGCESDKQAQQEPAAETQKPAVAAQQPAAEAGSPGAQAPRPAIAEATKMSFEATVAAIDHDTREVTLEGAEGRKVDLTVGDEVKNLPQVEVGDQVSVEYLEAVTVEVLGPAEADVGAGALTASGTAEPGEKPAGAEISEMIVVAVIEAIDKDNEQVTLKGPKGGTRTVKVRNPENLDKAAVGEKVKITYTRAFAVNVTERPAAE